METGDAPPTVRAFVGFDLPPGPAGSVAATQRRLRDQLGDGVGWTEPGNFHITLVFLGALDGPRLAEAQRVLREVAPRLAPARLALGETGAFPKTSHPRVLVRMVDDPDGRLADIHAALGQAYGEIGYKPNHTEFRPHVTLGYPHERKPVVLDAELAPDLPEWTASRLTLFVGHETPEGLRYLPADVRTMEGK